MTEPTAAGGADRLEPPPDSDWPSGVSILPAAPGLVAAVADRLRADVASDPAAVATAVRRRREWATAQRVVQQAAEAERLARLLQAGPPAPPRDARTENPPDTERLLTAAAACVAADELLAETDAALAQATETAQVAPPVGDLSELRRRADAVDRADTAVRSARAALGPPVAALGLDHRRLAALEADDEHATADARHQTQVEVGLLAATAGAALLIVAQGPVWWAVVTVLVALAGWRAGRWRAAQTRTRATAARLRGFLDETGMASLAAARAAARDATRWTDRAVALAKAEDDLETAGRAFRAEAGPGVRPDDVTVIEAQTDAAAEAARQVPELDRRHRHAQLEATRRRDEWRTLLQELDLGLCPPDRLDEARAELDRRAAEAARAAEVDRERDREVSRGRLDELLAGQALGDLITAGTAAEPLARAVPRPLVVDDPFETLPFKERQAILDSLAELADAVTVVVVTSHPGAPTWGLPVRSWPADPPSGSADGTGQEND